MAGDYDVEAEVISALESEQLVEAVKIVHRHNTLRSAVPALGSRLTRWPSYAQTYWLMDPRLFAVVI
jgi:hypothetical protein